MRRVAELMTEDPSCIGPGASALGALDLMIDRGVRHLPVIDRHGRVCGIVSIDDLRAAFPFSVNLKVPPSLAERDTALGTFVGEVMTHGPITTSPSATLADAAALLVRFRIGCLPVVDGRCRLVGIFSETDALRALVSGAPAPSGGPGRVLDLELLGAELRSERDRIATQLERMQTAEREPSGAEAGAPLGHAERSLHMTELSVEEPLAALSARRLEEIDHALARAARGQLGRCEKCGNDIPVARLRALPGTVLCVRCAAANPGVAR
jgi:CBS domain-containing protein